MKPSDNRIKKKTDLLKCINDICQHLDSIMDVEVLYSKVVQVICEYLGYDHVALYLVDYNTNSIVLFSLAGIYQDIVPSHQTLNIDQGIVGNVVRTGKTVLSNDVSYNTHFYNITPNVTPTKSELCVPIRIKDKIIGVLNIESTKIMNFDEDDLNSLEVLANRIGVSIQNSRLYDKLEKNTQRLYDIVSSMGQGILLINKNFQIEWVNETYKKMVYSEYNAQKQTCYRMFGKSEPCLGCPADKIFQDGEIRRHIITTKKNRRYYSAISAPIKDDEGRVKQILEVIDDVTENMYLRKKLDVTKERLNKLQNMAVIGELTSSIAHEIRNPLNAISTAIGALQYDLILSGDDEKLMNIVKEETNRLDKIIYNYLNLDHNHDLNIIQNDLQKTIEEVVLLLKMDKNVNEDIQILTRFSRRDIPKLKFDKDSIKQVLWNLLINSVQSISSNGIIEVISEIDNSEVKIIIKDNGKGIPKEDLKKIFQRFHSSKSRGLGLGLSIVKRIIEKHDWFIDVESELERGTVFTITIPIESKA